MKLKKKVKRLIIVLLLIAVIVVGFLIYKNYSTKEEVKEVKVINQIEKYGYSLKENKPAKYKEMFNELKEILSEENVDEEKYVSKISEMFVYDFYSLKDKTAKTDIGGVDFVYSGILENFLENAQDTYYKYIENNIYNDRKQNLPVVTDIKIDSVEQKDFTYGEQTDQASYTVKVTWDYTDNDSFNTYQKEAELVFIHDDIKLSLVELQ